MLKQTVRRLLTYPSLRLRNTARRPRRSPPAAASIARLDVLEDRILLSSVTVDFDNFSIDTYGGGNDVTGPVTVEDDGATLQMAGNRWKKIDLPYDVTADTLLEFDFQSGQIGEIHGIGFDTDLNTSSDLTFRVYGTQSYGISDFDNYAGAAPGVQHYVIPVGQYYTGQFSYLFFVNDLDVSNPTAESRFSNVRIHDGTNEAPVAVDDVYDVVQGGTLVVNSAGGAGDIQALDAVEPAGSFGEKPQSKVWEYDNTWWAVFSDGADTFLWRLDDSTWTKVLEVSSRKKVKADVKVDGDLAHILLEDDKDSYLRSLEYVSGSPGGYQFWSQQPNLVDLNLSVDIETATIDIDSTGRMWMAYDNLGDIAVRYSDAPYTSWSSEIVLAGNATADDLASVIALDDGTVGVFWSNQTTQRFGFRLHVDGTDPNTWLADEVPASQSALSVGDGMADDHVNLAAAPDGTLYAAVKTGYDSQGFAQLALLVRRPGGTWDDLHFVSQTGTRPIVQRNDATGELLYIYRQNDTAGPIVYRTLTDTGSSILVGAEQFLFGGAGQIPTASLNDPSSTKAGFTDELVVIAKGDTGLAGARLTFSSGVLANDTDADGDSLTAELVAGPDHGALTFNTDGTFTYTHDGGNSFADSFTYRAHDGTVAGNVGTVSITIPHVNVPPDAVNDAYVIAEGATLAANDADGTIGDASDDGVLANDTDAESDPLTAVLVDGPLHGTLVLNLDGTFTYSHDGSENHSDSFTYRANDGSDDGNLATVDFTITPVNDSPLAVDDAYTLEQGTTLTADDALGVVGNSNDDGVLANDTDAENDTLFATLVDGPVHGLLTLNADGTFSYAHDDSENFSDSFTYRIDDGTEDGNVATVQVTITPMNDPPVAADENYTTTEAGTIAALDADGSVGDVSDDGVLVNDTDPDGDPLTALLANGPAHGSLTFNADGTFVYTHDGSENFTDSFSYRADDGAELSDPATVSIAIAPVNDPPSAVDDTYTVGQGAALLADDADGTSGDASDDGVLVNDVDAENDPLTAILISGPAHGILNLNADGTFDYTHDGSNNFSDSFSYQARDTSGDAGVATVQIDVLPDTSGQPNLRTGVVSGVTNSDWTTVVLDRAYDAMVVVVTPNYGSGPPLVARVQNATGDSFQVRLQRADGSTTAVAGIDVHYIAVEEGVYTEAAHGVSMEAMTYTSSVTDNAASWVGESRSYAQSYTNPVVLGQVMTANDADFSIFWSRGETQFDPPSSSTFFAGKHVGEDGDTSRLDETVGYLVIEAGSGSIDGLLYEAALGVDVVGGFDSGPPFPYTLGDQFTPTAAVAAMSGVNGANGGWAVLYGADPVTSTTLNVAIDEDQLFDAERGHIGEQVAYFVIGAPSTDPVTVAFQQGVDGYAGARDTTLRASDPDKNYGDDDEVKLDGSPDKSGLLSWDIGSIPSGSTVLTASLTFDVTNKSDDTFEIYELLTDWSEGEATWELSSGLTSWQTAGAQGAADRGSTVLGTVVSPSEGELTVDLNADGIALLQSWIDNPSSNRGFIIQDYSDSSSNGLVFSSGDDNTVSQRPRLTITYDPTGGPPVNREPIVDAGGDQAIFVTDTASLDGTVTDDALPDPPASPTTTWSVVSGPGSVTFGDANSVDTTAQFSDAGTYVLLLTADDGELSAFDDVIITVAEPSDMVTVSFQDGLNGYSGASDSFIEVEAPTSNFGSATELEIDGKPDRAALLRWDVGDIAAGSVVDSVSITLLVTNRSGDLYEVYGLSRDWVENEVTWQQAAAGTAWEIAGATGAGDHSGTPLTTLTSTSTGFVTFDLNAAGVVLVQSWIDDASTNHGLIVQDYDDSTSNGLDISSRDDSDVANRPMLTVTYSAGSQNLLAADAPPPTGGTNEFAAPPPALTEEELAPLAAAAAERLAAAAPQLSAADLLDAFTFGIVDLPGSQLAALSGNSIQIDIDAAGIGWFIDSTPLDDAEFSRVVGPHELTAATDSPAAGRIDLLSVLTHEYGHAIGLGHSESTDAMNSELPAGTRRLIDEFFASLYDPFDGNG